MNMVSGLAQIRNTVPNLRSGLKVTHFSFWSILKSPLILGNDVTNMSNETLSIITNSLVISINQDVGSGPASRMWKRPLKEGGDLQLWAMTLANKSVHWHLHSLDRSFPDLCTSSRFVIALLNTSPKEQTVDVDFTDAFVDQVKTAHLRVLDIVDSCILN